MKKILFVAGVISLCLICNVIYAKQRCIPKEDCYVENCTQTAPCIPNNCEAYNCYTEQCPQNEVCVQNNCVRRNQCSRVEPNYGQHHKYSRHH